MKIHAYIPYATIKKVHGIKTIKDADRILRAEIIAPLREFANVACMTIWDDSGYRCYKVGIDFMINADVDNAMERVTNIIGSIAEEVEELRTWLNRKRAESIAQ